MWQENKAVRLWQRSSAWQLYVCCRWLATVANTQTNKIQNTLLPLFLSAVPQEMHCPKRNFTSWGGLPLCQSQTCNTESSGRILRWLSSSSKLYLYVCTFIIYGCDELWLFFISFCSAGNQLKLCAWHRQCWCSGHVSCSIQRPAQRVWHDEHDVIPWQLKVIKQFVKHN